MYLRVTADCFLCVLVVSAPPPFVHLGDRCVGLRWMNNYLLPHRHLQYEIY
jgi:hypothetical protein